VTSRGKLHIQEYLVKFNAEPRVLKVVYEGVENARPAPGVLEALEKAERIVISPSNPFLSIGPILSVRGIREALRRRRDRVVAVSPLSGGRAFRGPLAKIMAEMGLRPSSVEIARIYADVCSHLVIDRVDRGLSGDIERLGVKPAVTDISLAEKHSRVRLARFILSLP